MYFITIGKRQRQQTFPAHGLFTTSPIWPLSCSSQAPGPPRTGWLWELKCVEPDGVAHHDPHPHPQERSPPRWARAAPLLILYPRDQASHVPSLSLASPSTKGGPSCARSSSGYWGQRQDTRGGPKASPGIPWLAREGGWIGTRVWFPAAPLPSPSRRETMTVHRGCGKSDTSQQNGSVEVALSQSPSLGLLPMGPRRL